MMRISPILRWDYAAVWNCLRGADLAFCSLYAQGYTSLGLRSTSVPNPALLVTPTAAGAGAGAAPAEAARAADSQPAGADTAASAASVANAAASAASVADTAAGAGTVADTAAGAGTVADTAAGAGTAAPGGVGRIDRAGPGSDAQTYLPAWELKDARLEREGRRKR
jgi:3'-phosphoadenosine 5'-phosphosulfate sulfotransferase (PAPS reductase)/FAD synthetase